MKAERLIELYGRIADAPDAGDRLRRFILNLAVRGKLCEQRPRDGSAEIFDPKLPDVSCRPFTVPNTWRWSRLSALGELKGGGTPAKSRDDYWGSGVPWVSPKDMKVDAIYRAQLEITDIALEESAAKLIDTGSVLFVVRGMILAHSFPIAISQVPLAINQDMKALVLNEPKTADYLLRALKGLAPEMLARVQRSSHGTCRIESNQYKDFLIPIPPQAEQHRIVAKVDELMALCDRLEATHNTREAMRDRLTIATFSDLTTRSADESVLARFSLNALPKLTAKATQIKSLRHAIYDLAATGRLSSRNSQDNLTDSIDVDRSQESCDLPVNWDYVQLQALLSEKTRNGYSRRPDDAETGVPILRISAGTVRMDGLVAEEEHKRISGINQTVRDQYGLEVGDLLACRFNGNKAFVGRLTLFSNYLNLDPIYPDKLIRVRLDRQLAEPKFIRIAGESTLVRRSIEELCATTVGNWGISASKLKQVAFPLPPLAEQHRIVAKVAELMALCDRLEASLQQAEDKRSRLLEAIIAEALAPAKDKRSAA